MLNKVIIMGRLTKDPEIRYAQGSNMAIAKFNVAVERDYQKQGEEKQVDFISCIAFDKKADFVQKYFAKGNMIAIEGHLQTGSYKNKDNQTVYTTDVIVDKVSFTGEKREATPQASPTTDGFMEIPNDFENELPFN